MLPLVRHPSFTCSICTSPPEIRALVDAELSKDRGQRKPLRVLAELTTFSKSALSRHDRGCLSRAKLEAFRDRRKKSNRIGRIILKDATGDGPPVWTQRNPYDEYGEPEPFHPSEGLQRNDLFLVLTNEPLRPDVIRRSDERIQALREIVAVQTTFEDVPTTDGQTETEEPLE
jgi:hypothetical protein